MNNRALIEKLEKERALSEAEYLQLLSTFDKEDADLLAAKARGARERVYGNRVFFRGLIEISNICKNDCYYCGIRASNKACER